jgi:hypothetical protein
LSYGDQLVLINSILSSLPMFLLSFFEIPKGEGKDLIFIGLDFFSKARVKRRNTDFLNETSFVDPKTKGV